MTLNSVSVFSVLPQPDPSSQYWLGRLQILNHVLLTGAGFTHNFGGFLAPRMWSGIFNSREIQASPRLVHLLRNELDYENAYVSVMHGDYPQEEREAFTKAVAKGYDQLDAVVRRFTNRAGSPYPVDLSGVSRWLVEPFAGREEDDSRGYFFTLNQDLFIERWYLGKGISPGLSHQILGMENKSRPLTSEDFVTLPTAEKMAEVIATDTEKVISPGQLHYIKLHGSMNWRSSDGRQAMVIGGDKMKHIGGEPLLAWYFKTFKRVLSLPNRRLLVIGYGFRDHHINETIATSIVDHGLKLYVICPQDPASFHNELRGKPSGPTIWGGLAGYFPYQLKEVYPADRPETEAAKEITDALFGGSM